MDLLYVTDDNFYIKDINDKTHIFNKLDNIRKFDKIFHIKQNKFIIAAVGNGLEGLNIINFLFDVKNNSLKEIKGLVGYDIINVHSSLIGHFICFNHVKFIRCILDDENNYKID